MAEERYKSRYANGLAVDDALDKGVSAYNDVGDLDDLTTTDNSDLVSAINEVNESVGTLATDTTQLKADLNDNISDLKSALSTMEIEHYNHTINPIIDIGAYVVAGKRIILNANTDATV